MDEDEFALSSGDEAAFAAVLYEVDNSTKRDGDIQPSTTTYSTTSQLAMKVLNEDFGLNQFRLTQEAIICRILEGGSAVVVFPTGGGKSLCYQVNFSRYQEAYSEYDAES